MCYCRYAWDINPFLLVVSIDFNHLRRRMVTVIFFSRRVLTLKYIKVQLKPINVEMINNTGFREKKKMLARALDRW